MKALYSLVVLLAVCTAGCATLLGDKSDDESQGGQGGCTDGATKNDLPADYSYSQCGTVFCGAFYEYICEGGEWRANRVHDCLCRSADAGLDGEDAGLDTGEDAGLDTGEDAGAQPDANAMADAQESGFDATPEQ